MIDARGAVVGTLSVRAAPCDNDVGADVAPMLLDLLATQAGHALDRLAMGERLSRTQTRLATEKARSRRSEATWHAAFDEAPIGMAVLRLDGGQVGALARVNDALCRITRRSAAQLTTVSILDLIHPGDCGPLASALARAVGGRRTASTLVLRLPRTGHGADVRVRVTTSPVLDDDPPTYAVSYLEDLSERANPLDEPGTERDPHTGLLTAAALGDALARTRSRALRTATDTAVLLCDLSLIDQRSTTLAPDEAAALRAELGRQVQRVLRPDDAVGQLDPNAFGVVLAELSQADAEAVAARVHAAITRTLATVFADPHGGAEMTSWSTPLARPADIAIATIDAATSAADTDDILRRTLGALRDGAASPSAPDRTHDPYRRESVGGTKIILWRRPEPGSEPAPQTTRVTLWQRPQP